MTKQFTAVFENGVLRPKEPIALLEGTEVEVVIVQEEEESGSRRSAEILAEIAALPIEGSGDPFTSRDHDKVLYGDKEVK